MIARSPLNQSENLRLVKNSHITRSTHNMKKVIIPPTMFSNQVTATAPHSPPSPPPNTFSKPKRKEKNARKKDRSTAPVMDSTIFFTTGNLRFPKRRRTERIIMANTTANAPKPNQRPTRSADNDIPALPARFADSAISCAARRL